MGLVEEVERRLCGRCDAANNDDNGNFVMYIAYALCVCDLGVEVARAIVEHRGRN